MIIRKPMTATETVLKCVGKDFSARTFGGEAYEIGFSLDGVMVSKTPQGAEFVFPDGRRLVLDMEGNPDFVLEGRRFSADDFLAALEERPLPEPAADAPEKPVDGARFHEDLPDGGLMGGVDHLGGLDASQASEPEEDTRLTPEEEAEAREEARRESFADYYGPGVLNPYKGPDIRASFFQNGKGGVGAVVDFGLDRYEWTIQYTVNDTNMSMAEGSGSRITINDLGIAGNPYGDPTHIEFEVFHVDGFDGIHVEKIEGDFNLPPARPTLKATILEADDHFSLAVDLSHEPRESGELKIQTEWGEFHIPLEPGKTHYELSTDMPDRENPYGDYKDSGSAEVSGGGFALPPEPSGFEVIIPQTETDFGIKCVVENGAVVISFELEHAPTNDFKFAYMLDNEYYTGFIAAGDKVFTHPDRIGLPPNPYGDVVIVVAGIESVLEDSALKLNIDKYFEKSFSTPHVAPKLEFTATDVEGDIERGMLTLDCMPREEGKILITGPDGKTCVIDLVPGQRAYQVDLPHKGHDTGTVKWTAEVTGGGFIGDPIRGTATLDLGNGEPEPVVPDPVIAATLITASLEDGEAIFTVSIDKEPKSDVRLVCEVGGQTFEVVIPAGQKSADLPPYHVPASPYEGEQNVMVKVLQASGGGFDEIRRDEASFEIFGVVATPVLSFTIEDVAGDVEKGTLTLDWEPREAGSITITRDGADPITIDLVPGKKTYLVDLPHDPVSNPYSEGETIEWTAEIAGGGFVNSPDPVSSSLDFPGAPTKAEVEFERDGDKVAVKVKLENPPVEETEITCEIDGKPHVVIVKPGETEAIVGTVDIDPNPYGEKTPVSVEIKEIEGGGYVDLNLPDPVTESFAPEKNIKPVLTFSVEDIEGDVEKGVLTLDWEPREAGSIVIKAEGLPPVKIDLVPGQKEYAVDLPHDPASSPYAEGETIEWTAEIAGGGFVNPPEPVSSRLHFDGVESDVFISLVQTGDSVGVLITLEHETKEPCEITYTINGREFTGTIEAGKDFLDAGEVPIDPNPYGDLTNVDVEVTKVTGGGFAGVRAPVSENGDFTSETRVTPELTFTIEDIEGDIEKGEIILDWAPKTDGTITISRDGEEPIVIDLVPGQKTYTVDLPHDPASSPYAEGEDLTWTATVTGGGFVNKPDPVDSTLHLEGIGSGSGVELARDGDKVDITLTLDHEPNGEVTITYKVNGEEKSVTIDEGSKTIDLGSVPVIPNPYGEKTPVSVEIVDISGGGYADLKQPDGVDESFAPEAQVKPVLSFTIEDIEGDVEKGTLTLDWEPKEPGTITITREDADPITIDLVAGQKTYQVDLPHDPADNPYTEGTTLAWSATVTGGGFVNLPDAADAGLHMDGIPTKMTIEVSRDGDMANATVFLENAPRTECVVKLSVNGEIHEAKIPAGTASFDIDPVQIAANPYGDATIVEITILSVTGGDFAKVTLPDKESVSYKPENPTTPVLTFTIEDIEGDIEKGALTLDWEPKEPGTVTITRDGADPITVDLVPGQKEYSVDLPHDPASNPYEEGTDLAWSGTVSGGGFVNPPEPFSSSLHLGGTETGLSVGWTRDGASIDFHVDFENIPRSGGKIRFTLNGEEFETTFTADEARAGIATVEIEDNPYGDKADAVIEILEVTGGDFAKVVLPETFEESFASNARVRPEITLARDGDSVNAKITLDYPARGDCEITYTINGETRTGIIGDGESVLALDPIAIVPNPYGDKTEVKIEVTGIAGGGFVNPAPGDPAQNSYLPEAQVTPTLTFNIEDIEGDVEKGELTLDWDPRESGTITIARVGADPITVELVAGQKTYEVNLPHDPAGNPYADGEDVVWTATVSGGGFVNEPDPADAGLHLDGIPTKMTIEATRDGDVVNAAISLENAPKTDCVVEFSVNGDVYEMALPAGTASFDIDPVQIAANPYGDATTVEITILSVTGGDFAKVTLPGKESVSYQPETQVTPVLSFTIEDIEGDIEKGELTLDWEPKEPGSVTITRDGADPITVDLVPGQKTYTVDLSHDPASSPYAEGEDLTWTAEVTGGGFVNEPDPVDSTLHLDGIGSGADIELARDGDKVDVDLTLDHEPKSEITITYKVNGEEKIVTVPEGSKEIDLGSVDIVPNPYGEETPVKVEIVDITGGGYADLELPDPVDKSYAPEAQVAPVLSFTIEDTEGDIEKGQLVLDWSPKETGIITISRDGADPIIVNLVAGQKTYSVDLPHDPASNPYEEGEDLSWKATVSGGGFVNLPESATSTMHMDGIESGSALEMTRDGDSVEIVLTLDYEARSETTITYNFNGEEKSAVIAAGSKIASLGTAAIVPNPYGEETTVKTEVTNISGGGFADLKLPEAAELSYAAETQITPTLTFTIDDIEGDIEKGGLTLDWAPKADGSITISRENAESITVNLVAGQKSYEVDLPHDPASNPYADGENLTWTATVTGGGFANLPDPVNSGMHMAGIESGSTLEMTRDGDSVEVTLTLDYAAKSEMVVTYKINGEEKNIVIPSGEKAVSLGTVAIVPNPYGDETAITAEVTDISGGGFADLKLPEAAELSYAAETQITPTLTFTIDDIEGDIEKGGLTLDWAPKADGSITISRENAESITVNLVAGQKSYEVDLPHDPASNPYEEGEDLSWSATVSGGGFVNLPESVTSTMHMDGIESGSTLEMTRTGDSVEIVLTLDYAAKSETTVTYNLNGEEKSAVIAAGSKIASLGTVAIVPNPYGDETAVKTEVTDISGGGFADLKLPDAAELSYAAETQITPILSFVVDDIEGDIEKGVLTLDWEPKEAGTITITRDGAEPVVVDLVAGQKTYSVDLPHDPASNPYQEGTDLAWKAEVSGGGFVNLPESATSTMHMDGIESGSALEMTRTGDSVEIVLTLDYEAKSETTVTYNLNGEEKTATIAAGEKTASLGTVAIVPNPYGEKTTIEAEVTDISGGGFADLKLPDAAELSYAAETQITPILSFVVDDIEGDIEKGTLTLDWEPKEAGTITITRDGAEPIVVDLVAGQKEYNVDLPHDPASNPYQGGEDVVWTATLAGGGFVNDPAPVTDSIHMESVATQTHVVLSEAEGGVGIAVSLDAAAKGPAKVWLRVNGEEEAVDLADGASSFTAFLPLEGNVFADPEHVSVEILRVEGGNFHEVLGAKSEGDFVMPPVVPKMTATIADNNDGEASVSITLDEAPREAGKITLSIDGVKIGEIELVPGQKSYSGDFPHGFTPNVYGPVNVEISGQLTGGGYAVAPDAVSGGFSLAPAQADCSVSLSLDGDVVTATFTLSDAPKEKTVVTYEFDGKTYTHELEAGETRFTHDLAIDTSDGAPREVTASVTDISGGGFANPNPTGNDRGSWLLPEPTITVGEIPQLFEGTELSSGEGTINFDFGGLKGTAEISCSGTLNGTTKTYEFTLSLDKDGNCANRPVFEFDGFTLKVTDISSGVLTYEVECSGSFDNSKFSGPKFSLTGTTSGGVCTDSMSIEITDSVPAYKESPAEAQFIYIHADGDDGLHIVKGMGVADRALGNNDLTISPDAEIQLVDGQWVISGLHMDISGDTASVSQASRVEVAKDAAGSEKYAWGESGTTDLSSMSIGETWTSSDGTLSVTRKDSGYSFTSLAMPDEGVYAANLGRNEYGRIEGNIADAVDGGIDGFGKIVWGSVNGVLGRFNASSNGKWSFIPNGTAFDKIGGGDIQHQDLTYTYYDKDGSEISGVIRVNAADLGLEQGKRFFEPVTSWSMNLNESKFPDIGSAPNMGGTLTKTISMIVENASDVLAIAVEGHRVPLDGSEVSFEMVDGTLLDGTKGKIVSLTAAFKNGKIVVTSKLNGTYDHGESDSARFGIHLQILDRFGQTYDGDRKMALIISDDAPVHKISPVDAQFIYIHAEDADGEHAVKGMGLADRALGNNASLLAGSDITMVDGQFVSSFGLTVAGDMAKVSGASKIEIAKDAEGLEKYEWGFAGRTDLSGMAIGAVWTSTDKTLSVKRTSEGFTFKPLTRSEDGVYAVNLGQDETDVVTGSITDALVPGADGFGRIVWGKTSGDLGTFTANDDGTWSFTPDSDAFDAIKDGEIKHQDLTYTYYDGDGDAISGTIRINAVDLETAAESKPLDSKFYLYEYDLPNGTVPYAKSLTKHRSISLPDTRAIAIDGHVIPLDGSEISFDMVDGTLVDGTSGKIVSMTCSYAEGKLEITTTLKGAYDHSKGDGRIELRIQYVDKYGNIHNDDSSFINIGDDAPRSGDDSFNLLKDNITRSFPSNVLGADGWENDEKILYFDGLNHFDSDGNIISKLEFHGFHGNFIVNNNDKKYTINVEKNNIFSGKLVEEYFYYSTKDGDGSVTKNKINPNWYGESAYSHPDDAIPDERKYDVDYKEGYGKKHASLTICDVTGKTAVTVNGIDIPLTGECVVIQVDDKGSEFGFMVKKSFDRYELRQSYNNLNHNGKKFSSGILNIELTDSDGNKSSFDWTYRAEDNFYSPGVENIFYSIEKGTLSTGSYVWVNAPSESFSSSLGKYENDFNDIFINYIVWDDTPKSDTSKTTIFSHGLGTMTLSKNSEGDLQKTAYDVSAEVRDQFAYGEMVRDEFWFTITDEDGTRVRSSMAFTFFGTNKDIAPSENAVMFNDPSTYHNLPPIRDTVEWFPIEKAELDEAALASGETLAVERFISLDGVASNVTRALASISLPDGEAISMDGEENLRTIEVNGETLDVSLRYADGGVYVKLLMDHAFDHGDAASIDGSVKVIFTNESGVSTARWVDYSIINAQPENIETVAAASIEPDLIPGNEEDDEKSGKEEEPAQPGETETATEPEPDQDNPDSQVTDVHGDAISGESGANTVDLEKETDIASIEKGDEAVEKIDEAIQDASEKTPVEETSMNVTEEESSLLSDMDEDGVDFSVFAKTPAAENAEDRLANLDYIIDDGGNVDYSVFLNQGEKEKKKDEPVSGDIELSPDENLFPEHDPDNIAGEVEIPSAPLESFVEPPLPENYEEERAANEVAVCVA